MKKVGAMELSIGTVVILVLAMTMLILGIILVRNIFSSASGAISEIDKGVKSAITDAFTKSNKKLVIIPSARTIEIKQKTKGQGFAFSIRNVDLEPRTFTYKIEVDPTFNIRDKCKINFEEANSWLNTDRGSINLGRGSVMEDPELILFNIPEDAPTCTIPYKITVRYSDGSIYAEGKIQLTIVER